VICFFKDGVRKQYDDVHHVKGRGKWAGDEREHYTNLMCVCRAHHPPPMKDPRGKQEWVSEYSRLANEKPINPVFNHLQKYE
jgi:hypothetical protein